MKKLLLTFAMGAVMAGGFSASAVTVDDLVGKVVGQVFWSNRFHSLGSANSCPVYVMTGEFEKVPGYSNRLKLSHFKNAEDVIFELNGNTLSVANLSTGPYYSDSNDGGQVRLASQSQNTISGCYTFVSVNDGYFKGDAQTLADGTIHFKLEGRSSTGYLRPLQFMKRSTTTNSANTATINDFTHTYPAVDLYIYSGNAKMNYVDEDNNDINLDVQVNRTEGTDKTTLKVRNFGGLGVMYSYPNEEQSRYVLNTEGATIEIDNNTGKATVTTRDVYGVVSPHFVYEGYSNTSYGRQPFFYADYTITASVELSNWDDTSVTGTFEAIEGEHSVWHPWDQKCGGKLVTTKTGRLSLEDWVAHYADNNGNQQVDFSGKGTEIIFDYEGPHTGDLVIDAYRVNYDAANPDNNSSNNVYVKCHLENKLNSRLIKDYELCMVPGNFRNINENHGHTIHDQYGFSNVVNVSNEGYKFIPSTLRASSINTNEDGSFEMVIPASVIRSKGWDLDNADNNKFTFFVKANYKDGSGKDGNTLAPTFHALNYTDKQISTGIESASFESDITIQALNGAIEVKGAENVEVYTAAGVEVYRGVAGSIAVEPGLYIVRADGKVAKLTVR